MMMREDHRFFLEMMEKAGRSSAVDVTAYYYVQNEESIVHSLGKKQKNNEFISCMVESVAFLIGYIERLKQQGRLPEEAANKLERQKSADVFITLHNMCRYSTWQRNKEVINHLRKVGGYPFKLFSERRLWMQWVMNVQPLWLAIVAMVHILPKNIRYRYL